MARYHEVPNHMKITSEMIEPAFQSIVVRLWVQAEHMKKTYGIDSMEYADALENLWQATERMTSLAGLCIDTPHAVTASMNHQRSIHKFIQSEIGINSYNDESFPFRHNTNISEESIVIDEARRELLKDVPASAEQLAMAAKSIQYMNSFNQTR